MVAAQPENKMLARALATYTAYSIRNDPLAELRSALPADLKSVGFMGAPDDLDISFWRPYGQRRVDHINFGETDVQIRDRKITYAIVSGLNFDLAYEYSKIKFEDWLVAVRAEVITNTTATIAVSAGPQKWYIVRFKK